MLVGDLLGRGQRLDRGDPQALALDSGDYLAGQGTEWEKLAEDQYDQLFHEAMNAVGVGMGANVVGKIVGKVGAKVTTGYLNRVLLIRLGRYAARLLRPVTKD